MTRSSRSAELLVVAPVMPLAARARVDLDEAG